MIEVRLTGSQARMIRNLQREIESVRAQLDMAVSMAVAGSGEDVDPQGAWRLDPREDGLYVVVEPPPVEPPGGDG